MIEKINLTKTNLRKIIQWSSSRYNEYKKSEVVEEILDKINKGRDFKKRYGTGSYAESGHLAGRGYTLEIKNGRNYLTLDPSGKKYELIVKQQQVAGKRMSSLERKVLLRKQKLKKPKYKTFNPKGVYTPEKKIAERDVDIVKIRKIARNYSNKTKTFEKEWWNSDTGYCPVAAYNLSKHLNSIGYKSLVIYGGYRWMDDHYWVSVEINNKEVWLDPTYYQFRYNKDLGGGVLIGSPKKFSNVGYKKIYTCPPEGMTKFRSDLFRAYSGGKNNPKYKV